MFKINNSTNINTLPSGPLSLQQIQLFSRLSSKMYECKNCRKNI